MPTQRKNGGVGGLIGGLLQKRESLVAVEVRRVPVLLDRVGGVQGAVLVYDVPAGIGNGAPVVPTWRHVRALIVVYVLLPTREVQ